MIRFFLCSAIVVTTGLALADGGRRGEGDHRDPTCGSFSGGCSSIAAFDADGDGSITAQELDAGLAKQQAALLARVDTNKDGAIGLDELKALDEDLAARLLTLDTNKDGTIGADELAAALAAKKAAILAKFDADGDGTITAAEIAAVRGDHEGDDEGDGEHGDREDGCDSRISPLLSFDTDGDGSISSQELEAGLAKRQAYLLEKVDTNKDGAIGPDELKAIDDDFAERLLALDTDKDGTISAAELAAALQTAKADILARFDSNGDGMIGADELKAASEENTHEAEDTPKAKASDLLASKKALFLRGDAVNDGRVDLADAVHVLSFLFLEGAAPDCLVAADANDDGSVDISDTLTILSCLFLSGGETIQPPYPGKGIDPTDDPLPCEMQ
jgi:Ca2+-binding EF-hand superfamily protein